MKPRGGTNFIKPVTTGGNSSSQTRNENRKVRLPLRRLAAILMVYFWDCVKDVSECRLSMFFLQVGSFTEYPPVPVTNKIETTETKKR